MPNSPEPRRFSPRPGGCGLEATKLLRRVALAAMLFTPVAACTFPSLTSSFVRCPCNEGWVCDEAIDRCVLETDYEADPSVVGGPPLSATDAGVGPGSGEDAQAPKIVPGPMVGTSDAAVGTSDAAVGMPDAAVGTPDGSVGTPCASDSDGDGTDDCEDACPDDPQKIAYGLCGCGVADSDSDTDGTVDCKDACPQDPNKTSPGTCGCGVDETGCGCPRGFESIDDECVAVCGDGIVAGAEQCDDGNGIDGDDCTNRCRHARCGDGIRWTRGSGNEACDDGNDDPNDACVSCRAAMCGDGWVRAGVEDCDGNGSGKGGATDSCTADCTAAGCGDGVVDPEAGEYCDDGNVRAGDGCDVDCYGEGWQLGSVSHSDHIDDSYENVRAVTRPCPDGWAGLGIYGKSGGWFDHFGLVCRKLDDGYRLTGGTTEAQAIGTSGGGRDFNPLMCPSGELLVALQVTYDTRIRALEGYCKPGALIRAGESNTRDTSRTRKQDTGKARDYAETDKLSCPAGSVVTGLGGYEAGDGFPSMLYLVCRAMDE